MANMVKPAILSISLLVIMTGNTVSPALADISEAFPHNSSALIKMVLTLPSFAIIPFSFISAHVSSFVNKRKIIIAGLVIYIIGGLSSGFSRTIYELLFFRGILGMGMGLIMPFSTSLIADFYRGTERTVMMGLSNAVSNLGGIIATLIAGALAIYNWRYIFIVYSIAILVLILIFWGLPEPPKKSIRDKNRYPINFKIFFVAFLAFILNIAFYSVITNMSLFIKIQNIGNSGYSGIAMSFITLGGFISGIVLRHVSKLFKRIRVPFAVATMSLGFLRLSYAYNLSSILIGSFMIGFGIGTLKPILFLKSAEFTPEHLNAVSISIVSNSILLGKFVSPFFIDYLNKIFNNTSYRFIFLSMAIFLGCGAITSLLTILYCINKQH
ncbi:MAG: MFS transporter [Maledivibacter sp.]|jgi:MFS family permease|nr:MFS transporter [Maledivibacter sp.]